MGIAIQEPQMAQNEPRKQWFINWQSQENLSQKIKDLGIYLIKYNFKAEKVLQKYRISKITKSQTRKKNKYENLGNHFKPVKSLG